VAQLIIPVIVSNRFLNHERRQGQGGLVEGKLKDICQSPAVGIRIHRRHDVG
jgi:hypothetical protein